MKSLKKKCKNYFLTFDSKLFSRRKLSQPSSPNVRLIQNFKPSQQYINFSQSKSNYKGLILEVNRAFNRTFTSIYQYMKSEWEKIKIKIPRGIFSHFKINQLLSWKAEIHLFLDNVLTKFKGKHKLNNLNIWINDLLRSLELRLELEHQDSRKIERYGEKWISEFLRLDGKYAIPLKLIQNLDSTKAKSQPKLTIKTRKRFLKRIQSTTESPLNSEPQNYPSTLLQLRSTIDAHMVRQFHFDDFQNPANYKQSGIIKYPNMTSLAKTHKRNNVIQIYY